MATKKFLVPFDEQELVWIKYVVPVEAKSKQEAYDKVKEALESGDSIHANYDYECDLVEIIEHIDSDCKYSIDDYDPVNSPLPKGRGFLTSRNHCF